MPSEPPALTSLDSHLLSALQRRLLLSPGVRTTPERIAPSAARPHRPTPPPIDALTHPSLWIFAERLVACPDRQDRCPLSFAGSRYRPSFIERKNSPMSTTVIAAIHATSLTK